MCEVAPPARPRTWGFRFSVVDGCAIAICGGAAWGLWDALGHLALAFPVVLGHFFLFCNVFRVRRNYELAWAASFLINTSAWWLGGAFTWWGVLGVQLPFTALAIGAEIRSARYHGVCARRWNRGLGAYLAGEVDF